MGVGRAGGSRAAAKVVVVGGGAGGVELALAMQYRLKELFREAGRNPDMVVVEIVNRGEVVLSSHNRFVKTSRGFDPLFFLWLDGGAALALVDARAQACPLGGAR